MNRTEHLLSCLAEECAEVAQRVSKALRFGLLEVQPGQELTNAQRIVAELTDVMAVTEMLIDEGALHINTSAKPGKQAKKAKVEKFMAYAEQQGALTYNAAIQPRAERAARGPSAGSACCAPLLISNILERCPAFL